MRGVGPVTVWLESFQTRIDRNCSLAGEWKLKEADKHIGHRNHNSSHNSSMCFQARTMLGAVCVSSYFSLKQHWRWILLLVPFYKKNLRFDELAHAQLVSTHHTGSQVVKVTVNCQKGGCWGPTQFSDSQLSYQAMEDTDLAVD